MDNIIALHDRVIVKPLPAKKVTKAGVILPDTHKADTLNGEVVAVGPGNITSIGKRAPMTVRIGDTVAYESRFGTNLVHNGVSYTVIPEALLFAIIGRAAEA